MAVTTMPLVMMNLLIEQMIHPSRHYEISLSLSQVCGVNEAPLELLSSGKCAPQSFGVQSLSLPRRKGGQRWLRAG